MPGICFIIYKTALNIKEKAAAVLQIANIPKAIIKPDWSVDLRDRLESLQTQGAATGSLPAQGYIWNISGAECSDCTNPVSVL